MTSGTATHKNHRVLVCTPRRLTVAQRQIALLAARARNPFILPDGPPVADVERIALEMSYYWGKGPLRLTVGFLGRTSPQLRARIVGHLNAWNKQAAIKFVESATDPEVRIARFDKEEAEEDMDGYWSFQGTEILGIDADRPTMNLEGFTMKTSEAEFRRVVRHEAGHTLGFPHEHQRPQIIQRLDREKTIKYFMKNNPGWTRKDVIEQVLTPLVEGELVATPDADQTSIMCYDAPASITIDGEAIVGGLDINAEDYAFAGMVYPKPKKKPKQAATRGAGGKMHVLLIGIDAYQSVSLSGCVNDIDAVQDLLLNRLHVPAAAIRRLTAPLVAVSGGAVVNALPSRENVLAALTNLASDAVQPDDRVFIYYAGHGTRPECRVGSRLVVREAIVTVEPGGESHVFDWEINKALRDICARTSAVTAVFDCCVSGSVTRGTDGSAAKLRFLPSTGVHVVPEGTIVPEADRGISRAVSTALVVAACLPDEGAREASGEGGVVHGDLTRALLAELAAISDEDLPGLRWGTIWRSLFATVTRRNALQHPWISSTDVRAVFGGPSEEGDAGYGLRQDGAAVIVDAGTLSGVTVGAEIGVYGQLPARFLPVGSAGDRSVRVGALRVITAELATATALPLAGMAGLPPGARGRLIRAGEAARLRVALMPADAVLAARLVATGLVTIVGAASSAELVLVRRSDGDWALTDDVYGTGEEPNQPALPPLPAEDPEIVARCVEHYVGFTAPLRLARGCRDLPGGLQVQLLACPPGKLIEPALAQDPGLSELLAGTDARHELRVGPGPASEFCIRVENTTDLRLYVSLIDCTSEGTVEALSGRETVAPGQRRCFWHPRGLGVPFKATLDPGLPLGIERYVVIGTTDPGATIDHLPVRESFADVVRGVPRGTGAGGGASLHVWTAAIVTARVVR